MADTALPSPLTRIQAVTGTPAMATSDSNPLPVQVEAADS